MQAVEAPMPPGSIESGRVVDAAAIGTLLRQMLASLRVSETRAMLVMSDSIASFRVMTFPRATSDSEVEASVKSQLPVSSPRIALRQVEVDSRNGHRIVYAVAWDRDLVLELAEATRQAGLVPQVADLKSLCLARVVPLPSCLVLDLTEETREVFLIDDHLPRLWHTFKAGSNTNLVEELADGMRPVLVYLRRLTGGTFGPSSPILVRSQPELPAGMLERLSALTGHPAHPFPQPARVPETVHHHPYLSCIGLVMRRGA